jgi:hypothetical protein
LKYATYIEILPGRARPKLLSAAIGAALATTLLACASADDEQKENALMAAYAAMTLRHCVVPILDPANAQDQKYMFYAGFVAHLAGKTVDKYQLGRAISSYSTI